MKPTSEILERIEKCSSEHKDGVFTRLYRYLLREDIYYAAYQKLYANKGATTQGIDDDTADGFSDFYVKELIQSLKDGTYKANPVRREYIPKKNGKLRPLGIPSFRDKLLQEVVRMILEAIYNGELFAAEMVVPKSTEYSDARKAVAELMNELESKLGKEDYAKVKELYDTMFTAGGIEMMEQFKFGVALGVLLMKEINELPYFPK